jgi:hypothetical protein
MRFKLGLPSMAAILLVLSACGPLSNNGQAPSKLTRLRQSRELALDWIKTARANVNNATYLSNLSKNSYLSKINQLDDILSNRIIEIDNFADGPCSENTSSEKTSDEFTLAYVENPPQNSNIYVCKEAFDFSNPIIAQVLIHEGIHITGVIDECKTTEFEVNIIHLAGQRPFKNFYVGSPACASINFNHINFLKLQDSEEGTPSALEWKEFILPQGAKY